MFRFVLGQAETALLLAARSIRPRIGRGDAVEQHRPVRNHKHVWTKILSTIKSTLKRKRTDTGCWKRKWVLREKTSCSSTQTTTGTERFYGSTSFPFSLSRFNSCSRSIKLTPFAIQGAAGSPFR